MSIGCVITQTLTLVTDDLLDHLDPAEADAGAGQLAMLQLLLDAGRRQPPGLGVVVAVERRHQRDVRDRVQRPDDVLLSKVQVDRALVHGRVRAGLVDQTEQRPRAGLDHGDGVRRCRAQRDTRRGMVGAAVDQAGRAGRDVRQRPCQLEAGVAEVAGVGRRQRHLRGGAPQVTGEHRRVRRIRDRGFGRPVEQLLRMARQVLVELILAGDQQPQPRAPAAGAAPLLAQRRHGAREAHGDRAVEHADVDAELERAGGDHAEQGAVRQSAFDRATLLGRVAGAVGGDRGRGGRARSGSAPRGRTGRPARSPCASGRRRSSAGRGRPVRRAASPLRPACSPGCRTRGRAEAGSRRRPRAPRQARRRPRSPRPAGRPASSRPGRGWRSSPTPG